MSISCISRKILGRIHDACFRLPKCYLLINSDTLVSHSKFIIVARILNRRSPEIVTLLRY